MKKTWSRIVAMAAVFLAVILVLFLLIFRRSKGFSNYGDQEIAKLPTLSFIYNGVTINPMNGYLDVTEEENYFMHGMLLPLMEGRTLKLVINKKEAEPTALRYRIYDSTGERLFEEKNIQVLSQGATSATFNITLTNLLPENEEGRLYFYLSLSDGREVFYATRTIYLKEHELLSFMDISKGLTDALLAKETTAITQYLSFTELEAATNLNEVTLKSSLRQATWASLTPNICSERTLMVYELSKTQACFSWNYAVESKENDHFVYYDVEEYFSMRKRDGKNFVLSYDRKTKEHFLGNASSMGTTSILLGIQSRKDVAMLKTDDNKKVGFVVNQSVYLYNYANNEMTSVFSMDDDSVSLVTRSEWYDIKLLRMEENGNITFSLMGYRTSGTHEGLCGLSVYQYDFDDNAVKELLFVPVMGSYEWAKFQCGQVVYYNAAGLLYFDLGGILYAMDTDSMEYQIVTEEISEIPCVSKDGSLIAWMVGKNLNQIFLMDMEQNLQTHFSIPNESLRPIGFLEHDFVYGICATGISITDTLDYADYLKELRVVDFDLNEKACYAKKDVYIKKTVAEEYSVVISCVQKNSQGMLETLPDDVLTSANHKEDTKTVDLKVSSSNMKYNYYYITFGKAISKNHLFGMRTGRFAFTKQRELRLTRTRKYPTYQAYIAGRMVYAGEVATDAITAVFDQIGVVMQNNDCIYDRDARDLYVTLSMPKPEKIMEGVVSMSSVEMALETLRLYAKPDTAYDFAGSLRQGQSVVGILRTMFGDKTVNLTGCQTSMILYYINLRHPVIAIGADRKVILLCAYNSNNVFIYDPYTGEKKPLSLKDEADVFFGAAGYQFVSYAN